MGAYPQGNRKARTHLLIWLGHLPYYKAESYHWLHPSRSDRYKSRYRIRRRFKMRVQAEEKEYEVAINQRLLYQDEDGWHVGLCEE